MGVVEVGRAGTVLHYLEHRRHTLQVIRRTVSIVQPLICESQVLRPPVQCKIPLISSWILKLLVIFNREFYDLLSNGKYP